MKLLKKILRFYKKIFCIFIPNIKKLNNFAELLDKYPVTPYFNDN